MDFGGEAFELAADGGLVDLEEAGDLLEGLLVEEVGGEQEAVFWREGAQGALEGCGKLGEGCWFGGFGGGGGS